MALNTILEPPAVVPVRDPVWLEVSCDGFRTGTPTASTFSLLLLAVPTAGQSFSLSVGGEQVSFTWVSGTPDDSGTQIQVGGDLAASMEFLRTALERNWLVDQYFTVLNAGIALVATARTTGLLPVQVSQTVPPNLVTDYTNNGSDGSVAPNYSANVQVYVERVPGSGAYLPVPAQMGQPDDALLARWNLRADLKPAVGYTWPTYGMTGMALQTKLKRRFYVAYWEVKGDPPVAQRVYRTAPRTAWYAGSQTKEHLVIGDVFDLMESTELLNPFLTYRGRKGRHEVSRGQDVYLGYYRRTAKVADQQIRLRAVVTYEDGSTQATTLWTDTNASGFEQGEVCLFSVGFDRNTLAALSTEHPVSYTVQVQDAVGAALSELYQLELMDTDANELFVGYVNSLGVVETTRLIGAWELGMNSEHEEVQRLLTVVNGQRPSPTESNLKTLLRGSQQKLKASTGYMDEGELYAQLDLLLSPEHKWLDVASGAWRPLRLVNAEHVVKQRGTKEEHLYALNLEWAVGDVEQAWSDRSALPAVPDEEAPEPGGG